MVEKTRRDLLKLAPLTALSLAGCNALNNETTTETTTTTPPMDTETTTTTSTQTTETQTTTQQPQETTAALNEKVEANQLSLIVYSLSKTKTLGEYQRADPGNTYAVIQLAIKNTAQDQFANFNTLLQTQLKGQSEKPYIPLLTTKDTTFQAGQLAPGEVTRGTLAFEIPEGEDNLTLLLDFSSSFTTLNRVAVDLSSESSRSVELEQTLRVPIHEIGESATHNGITATVHDATFTEEIRQYIQPDKDHEYAIIDLSTTNNTDEPTSISTPTQIAIKDRRGHSYQYVVLATAQLSRSYSSGGLGPGAQKRGKLAFEVPVETTPLYFTFEHASLSPGRKSFWKVR